MYIPDVELHEASSLSEASALLARHAPDARLLAGGTDLLVDLKTARLHARCLISLDRIPGLSGVSVRNGRLHIGALTTIRQLSESPVLRGPWQAIRDAALQMAAPQVRNLATVGGNIASSVPCADLPPILTALRGSVVLFSGAAQREVALESFFLGPRCNVLAAGEILTEVILPAPTRNSGAAYERFALRDGNGIAVAAVAAWLALDGGRVRDARIVLGAVAPVPKPAHAAGALLIGRAPDEDAFEEAAQAAMQSAEPISDVRGSAGYRRELVRVLTRRALRTACRRACGGEGGLA